MLTPFGVMMKVADHRVALRQSKKYLNLFKGFQATTSAMAPWRHGIKHMGFCLFSFKCRPQDSTSDPKILTKNAQQSVAFIKAFLRDRAIALEPTEQREQREPMTNREQRESLLSLCRGAKEEDRRSKACFSLCRVAKEEDECHIRTKIRTKILNHEPISPPWEGKAVSSTKSLGSSKNLALLASDSALADKVRERSDLLGGGCR